MSVPRAGEVDPLRRRFPHFPPPLFEMLEACLQVSGAGLGVVVGLRQGHGEVWSAWVVRQQYERQQAWALATISWLFGTHFALPMPFLALS